ncbi:Asp-tRNA(Asn)/Glu-tRNA(Gln) amidotransferase subunit GatC [Candidatus Parcubacteria bacterium]|nr:Asp-tRNA(Asn)/Glu-tRNA(Gln) amidotransferase subunit GatC [Candidatus Parcubacteria bacterium]
MITKEDVKKIADLSRLKLTEEEIVKMQKDLTEVLDYINLLNKADVSSIKTYFGPNNKENFLRSDKAQSILEKTRQEIIGQFSEKQGDYLKVKKILT